MKQLKALKDILTILLSLYPAEIEWVIDSLYNLYHSSAPTVSPEDLNK